jgi:hypothetical protein
MFLALWKIAYPLLLAANLVMDTIAGFGVGIPARRTGFERRSDTGGDRAMHRHGESSLFLLFSSFLFCTAAK